MLVSDAKSILRKSRNRSAGTSFRGRAKGVGFAYFRPSCMVVTAQRRNYQRLSAPPVEFLVEFETFWEPLRTSKQSNIA